MIKQADIMAERNSRAYEGYGWVILLASALLGLLAAVVTAFPPGYMLSDPFPSGGYAILAALGIASVGFNIFALAIILVPYRRYERWAWYTLWMLPLMWLSYFALAPDLTYYLVLTAITTVGLVLPYRRFFSGSHEESSRVS
jgi:hypothetical protein